MTDQTTMPAAEIETPKRRGRPTDDERLARARKAADQAQFKLQQVEAQVAARETRAAERARKDETRQKIIVGAIVLNHIGQMQEPLPEEDNAFLRTVFRLLDANVKLAKDREQLHLPPAGDGA